jgi:hypothetical protein
MWGSSMMYFPDGVENNGTRPRSRYYFWLNNPFIKTQRDLNLTVKIVKIYEDNKKAYGSPRIHAELKEFG